MNFNFNFFIAGIAIVCNACSSPQEDKPLQETKRPLETEYSVSQSQETTATENTDLHKSAGNAMNMEVKVIPTANGYGYQIYSDGKLLIEQKNIPAVQGMQYFKTDFQAKRTGDFVAEKIRKGIMPPSVTRNELDSLGVIE
jgi:hypothetical protein